MRYLLDTNILLRLSQPQDPAYFAIAACLVRLQQQPSMEFCFFLQNLSEFWNVCTRPVDKNGYSFSIAETDRRAQVIEGFCTYLPETTHVYTEWRRLVVMHNVSGVQVHDTKLVAGMMVHGISLIITLNKRDFARYPGITAATPDEMQ